MKQPEGTDAVLPQFVLKTTAHWKALAHPLRAGILRILTEQSLTNEELADSLGVEGGKLYFHTKTLLDAGLIEIEGTRAKGPITEKLYRAVARSYVANELPDTREEDTPPFDALMSMMLVLYRQAWRDTPSWTDRPHYAYHFTHRMTTERMREFIVRLKELVEEFREGRTDDPDALEYSFGVLLHAVPPVQPTKK